MLTVPAPPIHVQAMYSTTTGMLLRIDGKTRPATLDEVEQDHGQALLNRVMASAGTWVDLIVPTRSYRCWTRRRNMDVAVVIVPGFGKVEAQLHLLPGVELFNRICDAEEQAWRKSTADPTRGKGYVVLTDAEVETLKAAVMPPALRPITREVRRIDLSQFTPPTKPAA